MDSPAFDLNDMSPPESPRSATALKKPVLLNSRCGIVNSEYTAGGFPREVDGFETDLLFESVYESRRGGTTWRDEENGGTTSIERIHEECGLPPCEENNARDHDEWGGKDE